LWRRPRGICHSRIILRSPWWPKANCGKTTHVFDVERDGCIEAGQGAPATTNKRFEMGILPKGPDSTHPSRAQVERLVRITRTSITQEVGTGTWRILPVGRKSTHGAGPWTMSFDRSLAGPAREHFSGLGPFGCRLRRGFQSAFPLHRHQTSKELRSRLGKQFAPAFRARRVGQMYGHGSRAGGPGGQRTLLNASMGVRKR